MIGGGVERILRAADVISEIRKAFEKIQNLEHGQRQIADTLVCIDARVRELEAGLREARSAIKFAAVEAAQNTVNGAQGQLYSRLIEIELKLASLNGSLDVVKSQVADDCALQSSESVRLVKD